MCSGLHGCNSSCLNAEDKLSQTDATLDTVLIAVLTLMALDCGLQVRALEHLLATVAFGVSRARFALRAAVLALRYWPPFLVDVLEWPV